MLKGEFIHGTCVALGARAAILTGPSGSGKSDLALRFILGTPDHLEPSLIADDQTRIAARDGRLIAQTPETIAGQIEVRGIGIVAVPHRPQAEVVLIVELVEAKDIPRMPPSPLPTRSLCGIDVPNLLLWPFEASAALKLRLALQTGVW
jgi:serine kinase of HPr protein (carbohydrate metabolism regulator)